jgi:hypothetical protein
MMEDIGAFLAKEMPLFFHELVSKLRCLMSTKLTSNMGFCIVGDVNYDWSESVDPNF